MSAPPASASPAAAILADSAAAPVLFSAATAERVRAILGAAVALRYHQASAALSNPAVRLAD